MGESSWARAGRDTDNFRSKRLWFWGVEVVGSGAIAGLTALLLWDRSTLPGWEVGLITFGVFVGGFFLIYGMVYLRFLFRAPYRQRDEAREETVSEKGTFKNKIAELQSKLDGIKNARPNIVLFKTENFPNPIRNIATGEILGEPWFARVQFANDPLYQIQMVEASKVVGHVGIYGQAGQHLYNMIGRWAETKEIAVGGQPIEIDSIDIPANGRPYPMDIGLKYREDEEFYGYNNDNPRLAPIDWRDRQKQLPAGTYSVRVRLRGNNVDKEFWFNLTNKGKGENVELEAATTQLPTSHKEGSQT